jgi:hypothetical protein
MGSTIDQLSVIDGVLRFRAPLSANAAGQTGAGWR